MTTDRSPNTIVPIHGLWGHRCELGAFGGAVFRSGLHRDRSRLAGPGTRHR
jgi:hypothetical protein